MKNFLSLTLLATALSMATLSHAADATLDAAAKQAGAVVTASGLVYKSLKDGSGASPKASDTVKVNYPIFRSYPVAVGAGGGVWGTKARILSAI